MSRRDRGNYMRWAQRSSTGGMGADGKSAYELWKTQPGNSRKTLAEFLASLIGPAGVGLNNRGLWDANNIYNEGDYVFDQISQFDLNNTMWIFQGTPPYQSFLHPYEDTNNWIKFEAPKGNTGATGGTGTGYSRNSRNSRYNGKYRPTGT